MADEAGMEEFEAMMEAAAQAEADPWAVDEGDEEDWAAMEEMEREDPGLADGAAMNALMADQMAKTKRFRGGGGPTKRRLFGYALGGSHCGCRTRTPPWAGAAAGCTNFSTRADLLCVCATEPRKGNDHRAVQPLERKDLVLQ